MVRDTRGFATKFYTTEGIFDLVGNNIPVFFIQDGIKFPDIVHAVKPHPDLEIPQAQSAHDTFWDFVSLHTEAQAHALWVMSDRGIPRSFRMMEGFGVHTFRMVNAVGNTTLVKFHWKPKLGVHSVTWEEAVMINGADPDFHRRDLAEAILAGAYPEWELGLQVFPDNPEESFQGIDLLDPTKFVPEELAPIHPVGKMVLHQNPRNYFAETEQVAFHPGHLVPGIDVTNDPLLQVRLFSYIDTQLTRLGGPNFSQIPINQTHAPINDMFRDGFHQHLIHEGIAPYRPNSLDAGCPFLAGSTESDLAAFIDVPQQVVDAIKERALPATFEDHYSQARLFYRSLDTVEQQHVQQAYSFELGKCESVAVRKRQLESLILIDPELCAVVAHALGLPVPEAEAEDVVPEREPSPAVSQLGHSWPVDGRVIGLLTDASTSPEVVAELSTELKAAGMAPKLIAPRGGMLGETAIDRTLLTASSIEFDALLVLAVPAAGQDAKPHLDGKAGAVIPDPSSGIDPRVVLLIHEMFRQAKAIVLVGDNVRVMDAVGLPETGPGLASVGASQAVETVSSLLERHRSWARLSY